MRDYIGLIVFLSCLVSLFVGMIIFDQYKYQPWRCNNLSEMTGRESVFVEFDGCYIEVNKEMVPRERFVSIQQEGEK